VNFLHSGQQLEDADVEINPRPDGSEHGHPRSGGTVHLEAHPHQVLDDLLNLGFFGGFLHGNNHR